MWVFIAGIALVCCSVYLRLKARLLKQHGIPVTATVIRLTEEVDYQQGGSSYHPVLKYQVNGIDHEHKYPIPNFFSGYDEGQIITIYCSKKNSKHYVIQDDKGASYVLMLGIVCMIIGAIGIAIGQ